MISVRLADSDYSEWEAKKKDEKEKDGCEGTEELRGILGCKINVACFLVLLCGVAIAAALASIVCLIA